MRNWNGNLSDIDFSGSHSFSSRDHRMCVTHSLLAGETREGDLLSIKVGGISEERSPMEIRELRFFSRRNLNLASKRELTFL